MRITRRNLLRSGATGLGALMLPGGRTRSAFAAPAEPDTLVVLFLRGGADSINLCVPRGDEANYVALRQTATQDITLPPAPPELQLDGFFEFHPGLELLVPHFASGDLAVVQACGGTGDYSHFTAQDAMDRAAPGEATVVVDGWAYRALKARQAAGQLPAPVLALSGVSIGARNALSMSGPEVDLNLSFPSIESFRLEGLYPDASSALLEELFTASANPLVGGAGSAVFGALGALEGLADVPPAVEYPTGNRGLNGALQDAARLIKAPELGVQVIALDYGGWDHHSGENNRLQTTSSALAAGLSGFMADLGGAARRTLVLVMTEFGRTGAVNGGGGTDHGWASLMLALGGGVAGGRVLTRADPAAPGTGKVTPDGYWPGLGPGELHVQASSGEPRDLKATTDFRDVIGEVCERFMGLPADAVRDDVLRGYTPSLPGIFPSPGPSLISIPARPR